MTSPDLIAGVDFSAARDAGRRIWVAEAAPDGAGPLRLLRCRRGDELAGSGPAPEAALAALRGLIARATGTAFGLDFPFALPDPLMPEGSWAAFARGFAAHYPDAEAFRAACRAAGGGRELKRRTDREARTPFSVYNLRLYRQTYFGIRDILAPLAAAEAATVVPMRPPLPRRALLFEICPASLLKATGLYRPYKGPGAANRAARAAILDAMVGARSLAPPPPALAERILADPGGDALDSVLAAIGTRNALRTPGWETPRDELDAREGRVFW